MADKTKKTIEAAIEGGIFGAALGALITGKSKNTLAAIIVGAAIGASIKAAEEAKKTNIPILYAIEDKIYRFYPDGRIEYVKDIKRSKTKVNIPKNFEIE